MKYIWCSRRTTTEKTQGKVKKIGLNYLHGLGGTEEVVSAARVPCQMKQPPNVGRVIKHTEYRREEAPAHRLTAHRSQNQHAHNTMSQTLHKVSCLKFSLCDVELPKVHMVQSLGIT